MEKKLACLEQVREKLEKQMELLRQVLEDKEKEIMDTKNQIHQAKKEVVCEYRDSDALFTELGESVAEGFNDAFNQVKNSYPDLDVSHVTIETHAHSTAQPILLESTEDLLAENVVDDAIVDHQGQEKAVEEGTHHPEDAHVVEEDDTPSVQQQIFIFTLFYVKKI